MRCQITATIHFPLPRHTNKSLQITYVTKHQHALKHHNHSNEQWRCLVFKFNHLLTPPEILLRSACLSCSTVWPADNFPVSDCSKELGEELLGATANATEASTCCLTVWQCKACLRMKPATIMQSAEGFTREWDLGCSFCWTCQARSAWVRAMGVYHSAWTGRIKSAELKWENFLPHFHFPLLFHWQVTPIDICPRHHIILLQPESLSRSPITSEIRSLRK